MENVMFVIKCLIVTVVIVVCMQIRVGSHSVEGHLMSWIHHSNVSHTLQDVAEGAVKATKSGKDAVMNLVGSHEAADEPSPTEASTGGWFKIKRSAAYYRQKEREQQKAREREEQEARANEGDLDGTNRD
jgi:hypothetical protein